MRAIIECIYENNYQNSSFPTKEKELQILCDSLGIANTSKTEIKIGKVHNDEKMTALLSGKTVNLDELNFLAKRLDSFDANELTTFYAVAYAEKSESLKDLINLTFNTHCYSVVSDFSDLNAVGKQMYLTEQGAVNLKEFQNFDGQGYFEKAIQNNPNPNVTPYGIVYRNKNEYEHIYDGKHFPQYNWEENMGIVSIVKGNEQEYLYLPFEETELAKTLQRLGTKDIEECEIEIDSEFLSDKILDTITEGKSINDKLMCIDSFAKRLEEIGINEKPYLETLIHCLNPQTEKGLNIIMDSMYWFEVFPNIHTAEEYGRYMICDSGHFEYDENLEEYIDFEGYGSHRMKCESGAFTNTGYIVYHGYNMELSDMLSEINIEIKPQEPQMLKMYMPLKATTYYDENNYGDLYQVDFEIEVCPDELAEYEDEILKAMEENSLSEEKERGLMKYYGKADSVNAKVKRYDFSVETIRGELMGVATLELNAPLDDKEMAIIKEEISGQASDGFGESIEQKEIKCDGKEIYVSLWGAKDWSLKTAKEMGITEQCQEMQIGGM